MALNFAPFPHAKTLPSEPTAIEWQPPAATWTMLIPSSALTRRGLHTRNSTRLPAALAAALPDSADLLPEPRGSLSPRRSRLPPPPSLPASALPSPLPPALCDSPSLPNSLRPKAYTTWLRESSSCAWEVMRTRTRSAHTEHATSYWAGVVSSERSN